MGFDIFDKTMNTIEKSMDLRTRRHAILASNIANGETPNYRAREYDFASVLERATHQSEMVTTNARHLDLEESSGNPHIVFDKTGALGSDGNNVDLDVQVGKVSENARMYDSAANYLSVKLRMLRDAVRGPSAG